MKRTITLSVFDPASIRKAQEQVEYERQRLHDAMVQAIHEIVNLAYARMVSLVPRVFEGLANSITVDFDDEALIGRIIVGEQYGLYVEYGTGVVGAGSPHPLAAEDNYGYDVNGHGEKGWNFYARSLTGAGYQYYHTKGQPPAMYIYGTMKYIEEIAPKIVSERVGNA